ncbi:hypothetical protein BO86DRAFT_401333 [Aspergillus japonicus CBS 114.51]|uniref:Ankyrin n=1 Tax=Aspergillus japonicus CBS 114.51 TaxID=1448312 RepID=A0A8T8WW19_ASPJA|nr:hypothetical protein BO86DRAFT_401333 [Aspergillus japonicus CBS 114.51]RAH80047.1 hypothetical protein BO86DRAFT_401333 [Aspergillus japonicus CBS 114.51]
MAEPSTSPLVKLPDELHLQYACYLDARSLSRLSRTCKGLQDKFSQELKQAHEAHDWALVVVNYWGGEWEQTAAYIEARIRQDGQGGAFAVEAEAHRWKRYPRLHNAIEKGQVNLVQNYLQARGNPNLRVGPGARPSVKKPLLHWALYTGAGGRDATIVRLLLEYGADPNLDATNWKEKKRHRKDAGTALDWARREKRWLFGQDAYPLPGDAERIKLALSYGARASHNETIRSLYQMEDGSTLVYMAVVNGTDLMHLGFGWYDLVGLFGRPTNSRIPYTDEQVIELLELEPKLIGLASPHKAVRYIKKHRPALVQHLIQNRSTFEWLGNLCADFCRYL